MNQAQTLLGQRNSLAQLSNKARNSAVKVFVSNDMFDEAKKYQFADGSELVIEDSRAYVVQKFSSVASFITALEMRSYPRLGRVSNEYTSSYNGVTVTAKSRANHGHSGKGYTTRFYIDGKQWSRAAVTAHLTY